jgi:hypothetical protein
MKRKILIQIVIMLAMLATSFILYQSAGKISSWAGVSTGAVDGIAKGLAIFTILPSALINNIRKEARQ